MQLLSSQPSRVLFLGVISLILKLDLFPLLLVVTFLYEPLLWRVLILFVLIKLVYLMNIFPSFKDCEPEELTDWSMDEKCSFCNLQREAVSVSFSAMKLFLIAQL